MPYDGWRCVQRPGRWTETLRDGRIEKVLQPRKDEIHIINPSRGEPPSGLFLAARPTSRPISPPSPRWAPLQAPPFSMLLRKHLIGGRVASVRSTT